MRGGRKGREGAWETSPDKVLHGDCVYSSLQGVCNNNGYDFIQPEKSPLPRVQEITEQNGCIVSGSRQIKANGGDDAETFQLCPLDLLPAGSMHSLQRLGENSSGSAGSHCNANWTLNRANYCPPASVFITNPPPAPCCMPQDHKLRSSMWISLERPRSDNNCGRCGTNGKIEKNGLKSTRRRSHWTRQLSHPLIRKCLASTVSSPSFAYRLYVSVYVYI